MNMDKIRVATVPGSKSITNRALLLAVLSNRKYLLKGAQFSDDSRYFLGALKTLGFSVQEDETEKTVQIVGTGGRVPEKDSEIYVGSAGTAARFLTAMLAFSDGVYRIQASEQMARRPMKPLFDALASLGAEFTYLGEKGYLPVQVKGAFAGKSEKKAETEVSLDISESTQYLSALLMTASMLPDGLAIHITSEKKQGSYIKITRRMMEEFGVRTEFDGETYAIKRTAGESHDTAAPAEKTTEIQQNVGSILVQQNVGRIPVQQNVESILTQRNTGSTFTRPNVESIIFQIEPDVSAACYFYAAVMLAGGSVQVRHVHKNSMQGDVKFLTLLEQMGASVRDLPGGICVTAPDFHEKASGAGKNTFPGLEVNMNDFSDQAITLAALAPFASSPTVISGLAHTRRQESDRLHGIAENLSRMGIHAEESEDAVKIWPGTPKPCEIETYDDHRMAMGFALVGMRVPGMTIKNPQCCRKTFKEYFDEMEKVFGLKISDGERGEEAQEKGSERRTG